MSCKNSSIYCISSAKDRWNTKRLFNSNTGIFNRGWVEKKKKTLAWKDKINSFILREWNLKTRTDLKEYG